MMTAPSSFRSQHRTLPSAVLPRLQMFVPPVPLIDTPISPLAVSVPPKARKMSIVVDPNLKVSEDDDTLDLAVIEGARAPSTSKTGLVAFVVLLSLAYVMAIVATLFVTGTPAVSLLHHLRAAIGG